MQKFFPLWDDIESKHQEVVLFLAGLMSDPTPLSEHLYSTFIGQELSKVKDAQFFNVNRIFFESLYREAGGRLPGHPLHNPYINYYYHHPYYSPRDCSPVFVPSRLYWFYEMMENVVSDIHHKETENSDEIPECKVYICDPKPKARKSLMALMCQITQHQKVTDLFLDTLIYEDTVQFNLSEKAVSVKLRDCSLPSQMVQHLSEQISRCGTLEIIDLSHTSLRDVTSIELSNKATTLTYLNLKDTHMSPQLTESVCKQLKHLVHLEHLDLSDNPIGIHGQHIVETIQCWGPESPLKVLRLFGCQMPAYVCDSLLEALSICQQLTCHDLGGNV